MAGYGQKESPVFRLEGQTGMAGRRNQASRRLATHHADSTFGVENQAGDLFSRFGGHHADLDCRQQKAVPDAQGMCKATEFSRHFRLRREKGAGIQAIRQQCECCANKTICSVYVWR